ncbi:MAG: nodulation protein NfeD [Aquabacterium sp.]|nr:nodulation protein NfeD [Ferruginibacter sp.]
MKHIFTTIVLYFFMPMCITGQPVVSIKIEGPINPVTADFINEAIENARLKNATCLLIHLNTPGGLLQSTREIVTSLLESPVPVIVYVSPEGAHAGSAGVFITMAAHIAAMAEATNIGAAHPVNMQGIMDSVMSEKVTNDAAAFIRSIAAKRNRNLEWAEDAVRKSIAISAGEAILKHVVDLIAFSDKDLLNQVDGKQIKLNSGIVTLHTKNAPVQIFGMSALDKFFNIISDPNIAYLMLMLGFFGILFELFNPGAILPGIIGVIALVLAFYSMRTLPVNYAGLALIIFGVLLLLLEIKIVSHGMLAIGGIASLLLGSMMLIKASSPLELAGISKLLIVVTTALVALLFLAVIGAGLKAQKRKPVTGLEAMIGLKGITLTDLVPDGRVKVQGEMWNASSVRGNINKGEEVRINAIKKFTLYVEKIIS